MTERTSLLVPYNIPEDSYSNKTSVLLPFQLPEFVRDDPNYANFVLFLQAYYEWMEQEKGVLFNSKGVRQFIDIDTTLDEFLTYFKNDFMSFFPEGALVDERRLIKVAKELYQSKGTPASFKFLFRVLYNSDVNLFNTKDYVFRASDGKWVATRSLKLATTDFSWFSAPNYKIFGETSKAYATVEEVFIDGNNVRVVLSTIQGNFEAGEFIRLVDVHGHDYLVEGVLPRARVIGLLSSVTVDTKNRGNSYSVGDPVVFYGGLDETVDSPIGASGYISSVTSASIRGVTTTFPGQGYRKGAFTEINLISPTGANAKSVATTFTQKPYYVFLVPDDTIGPKANTLLSASEYHFANLINANVNTTLAEALSFPILKTFGIQEVDVLTTGTGYDGTTIGSAIGFYTTDQHKKAPLPNLGILPPPVIVNEGKNYNVGDKVNFVGGTGYGAWAEITAINIQTGGIAEITFIEDPTGTTKYPLGGMGYQIQLPQIIIDSATGSGAVLEFPGLVGNDAHFNVSTSPYGQVLEITLTNPGQNYVSKPGVSLRVEDLLIESTVAPIKGDVVYQGTLDTPTYVSYVDSAKSYLLNKFMLRNYNYDGLLNANTYVSLARGANTVSQNVTISNITDSTYTNGRKIYGNGIARAKANFTNGITLGSGVYSNEDGQPSAYSIFENDVYNEYTYLLQVEEALVKYKSAILGFLHPAGLNYSALNVLKNDAAYKHAMSSEKLFVSELSKLLYTSNYVVNTGVENSNTVVFTNMANVSAANVINTGDFLTIYLENGPSFSSNVVSANANTITLQDNWITTVPNVVIATANTGSDTINISKLTEAWNIATGNTVTYFSDFMHTYDSVSFDGVNFKQITHVDQPIIINNSTLVPTTIRVDSAYSSNVTGYLTFRQNVISSNVWVSTVNPII
jgi:hypothetical protein